MSSFEEISFLEEVYLEGLDFVKKFEKGKKRLLSKFLNKVHPNVLEHALKDLYKKLEPEPKSFKGGIFRKIRGRNFCEDVGVTVRPYPKLPAIPWIPVVGMTMTLQYGAEHDQRLCEHFEKTVKDDPWGFIKSRTYDVRKGYTIEVKLMREKNGYFFETYGKKFMYLSLENPNEISIYLSEEPFNITGLKGIVGKIFKEGLGLKVYPRKKDEGIRQILP
jgi:hypothetical protein